jgi:Fe2+ or Zn2+ uptake regulation protein
MNDESQAREAGPRPAFMSQLRAAGLRPSVVRLCVLQTLADAGTEWQRGEEVFRRMLLRGTSVSLTTVYRILKEFERCGLIVREWVRSRGGALAVFRYQAPDAGSGPVRMRCGDCGVVAEVHDRDLHEVLARVALSRGLPSVGAFDVQIHGPCTTCRNPGDAARSARGLGEAGGGGGSGGAMLPMAGFHARPRTHRLSA